MQQIALLAYKMLKCNFSLFNNYGIGKSIYIYIYITWQTCKYTSSSKEVFVSRSSVPFFFIIFITKVLGQSIFSKIYVYIYISIAPGPIAACLRFYVKNRRKNNARNCWKWTAKITLWNLRLWAGKQLKVICQAPPTKIKVLTANSCSRKPCLPQHCWRKHRHKIGCKQ